jgi:photosystem II stability/assembly factor-like uncharacterized protein
MAAMRRIFVAFSYLILVSWTPALGQNASMQLITSEKGWARGGQRQLFWTDDGGQHWNDVTPSKPGSFIADIFFLDTSRGWVLLRADAGDDRVRFDLATTANAGRTWSLAPVSIPSQYSAELSGAAWVDFIDAEHGWIEFRKATSSAFSVGRLLVTQDGGKTWRELPQTPFGARVVFINATDGWAIDNLGPGGFCQTRDGGKTWEDVDLHYPSGMRAEYSSLRFSNAKHGAVAVILSAISDDKTSSKLMLFVTDDGGRNWKHDRDLALGRNMYGESAFPSTLSDSTLVSILSGFTLTTVDSTGAAISKHISTVSAEASEVSFVTPAFGWVRTNDDKLLSTTNGGESWTWLVPGSASRSLSQPTPKKEIKMEKLGSVPLAHPMAGAAQPAAGLHYTERLGFDQHQVGPVTSSGQMTKWWASSPFFDVGFYVGGANYCYSYNRTTKTCTIRLDPNLIPSWVTGAQNLGWGFLPVWVGEQAPCNTGNVTMFDYSPSLAQSEGGIEAVNAANAMTALGLAGTVVFYDMENYSAVAGSACSLAVQAFLTGWVNGMNANGFTVTGVYGNPGPAERDFSQVPNLSEVWITQVQVTGNNSPRVTIWGLGSGSNALEDILWEDSQRGHQYLIDAAAISYGGISSNIDFDVENLQIPGGSGTKPYTFSILSTANVQNLSPYFAGTGVTGMNDIVSDSNGTHFVTAGQAGQVVGFYETAPPSGVCNSACFASFVDNNGTLTTFLDPNSIVYTAAYGINNAVQAVGFYCYGTYSARGYQGLIYCNPPPDYDTYTESGFLGTSLLGSPSFTNIKQGSGIFVFPLGINDAGVVVGQAGGAENNCFQSWNFGSYGECPFTFFYQSGQLTSTSLLDCPGQVSNLTIMGINGFNQLVGYYLDASGISHGFVYNTEPPDSQDCIPVDVGDAGSSTWLTGINNQGQVIGSYSNATTGSWFYVDNGVAYLTQYEMWDLNDATQIAAGYLENGWKPPLFITLSPI